MNSPFMNKVAALRLALVICAGTTSGAAIAADGPNIAVYEQDVSVLASNIARYRYRLKSTPDGAEKLADLEAKLARLRTLLAQLKEEADSLAAADRKVHYLEKMEVEPKLNEFTRVKNAFENFQREAAEEKAQIQREIDEHNARKGTFGDNQAAIEAYNAAAQEGNARDKQRYRRIAEREGEFHQQLDVALTAYRKVQTELNEAETKRATVAEHFNEHTSEYAEQRAPLVDQLRSLDQEPPPQVTVPLQPFEQSEHHEESALVKFTPPPIGPGGNIHALDQLRVVTQSSRDAAGRDANDQTVREPGLEEAKVDASYGFDDPRGTGIADLPNVDLVQPDKAVPLVIVPPAAQTDAAPAAVKNSPVLQRAAQQQTNALSKLDELYNTRGYLTRQGPAASPEAWTKVVNEISKTQADLNTAKVVEQLSHGSKLVELGVTPKRQKKISDLSVPPPPSPTATSSPSTTPTPSTTSP